MANAPKTNADNDYNIGHRARDIQTEKIPNSLAETPVDTGEQITRCTYLRVPYSSRFT